MFQFLYLLFFLKAVSKGAEELFFNTAKEKLTGVEVYFNYIQPKIVLDSLTGKYNSVKSVFDI